MGLQLIIFEKKIINWVISFKIKKNISVKEEEEEEEKEVDEFSWVMTNGKSPFNLSSNYTHHVSDPKRQKPINTSKQKKSFESMWVGPSLVYLRDAQCKHT